MKSDWSKDHDPPNFSEKKPSSTKRYFFTWGKKGRFYRNVGGRVRIYHDTTTVNITLLVNIMQVPDKRRNAGNFLVTVKLHFPLTLFWLMNAE